MKNILKFLALVLLVLAAVLLINTYRTTSRQMSGLDTALMINISDTAVFNLSGAIQFRTVSNADPTMIDSAQFYSCNFSFGACQFKF